MHFMCQNRLLTGFGHDGLQKIAMGGRHVGNAAQYGSRTENPNICWSLNLRHGGPGQTGKHFGNTEQIALVIACNPAFGCQNVNLPALEQINMPCRLTGAEKNFPSIMR